MLIISSSAKTQTLNLEKDLPAEYSKPEFIDHAVKINNILKEKSARQNRQRFQDWQKKHNYKNSRPALSVYKGTVYQQMNLSNYNRRELEYIQRSLRIISAFYGILHGLSLMQPYRLEMKHRLSIDGIKQQMYKYWKPVLTRHLNQEAKKQNHKYLINLASSQYAKAVDFKQLEIPVINIRFKTKKARGMMIDHCAKHRIEDPYNLRKFARADYSFNKKQSTESNYLFTR